MTTLKALLGGNGKNQYGDIPIPGAPIMFFLTSQTWTPGFTGRCRVHVVGAGGGGYSGAEGTGGGAGGYARKNIDVNAADTFTLTIAAGGVTASPGGATSFVGAGHNVIGNGGTAGLAGSQQLPALGGTASGGDRNITGGSGGKTNALRTRTGGGAVGLLGVGISSLGPSSVDTGWGGAGIGAANFNNIGGLGSLAIAAAGGTRYQDFDFVNLVSNAGDGEGGDGGNTGGFAGVPGGRFAGGGGAGGSSGANRFGGDGGYGGGGGAAAATFPGGTGGQGIIIIEILSAE